MDRISTDDHAQFQYYHSVGYFQDTPEPYADLGEIVAGLKPGRQSLTERTLAINLGLAMDDMAVAPEIYRRAKGMGIGTCAVSITLLKLSRCCLPWLQDNAMTTHNNALICFIAMLIITTYDPLNTLHGLMWQPTYCGDSEFHGILRSLLNSGSHGSDINLGKLVPTAVIILSAEGFHSMDRSSNPPALACHNLNTYVLETYLSRRSGYLCRCRGLTWLVLIHQGIHQCHNSDNHQRITPKHNNPPNIERTGLW